jgi:hypothetical protein
MASSSLSSRGTTVLVHLWHRVSRPPCDGIPLSLGMANGNCAVRFPATSFRRGLSPQSRLVTRQDSLGLSPVSTRCTSSFRCDATFGRRNSRRPLLAALSTAVPSVRPTDGASVVRRLIMLPDERFDIRTVSWRPFRCASARLSMLSCANEPKRVVVPLKVQLRECRQFSEILQGCNLDPLSL